jgi:hypothetical protein
MKAREHRLYLMRFVAKLWHVYVHMPILVPRKYPNAAFFGPLAYLKDMMSILNKNIPKRFRFFGRTYTLPRCLL